MNAEQILDAMGMLDEDILQETDTLRCQKRPARRWMRLGVLAACLCLLVMVAARLSGNAPSIPTEPMETIPSRPPLPGEAGWSWEPAWNVVQDETEASEIQHVGYFQEALDDRQLELLLPAVRPEGMQFFRGEVGFNGEGIAVDAQLWVRIEKTQVKVFLSDGSAILGNCENEESVPVCADYHGVTFQIYQRTDGKKNIFEAHARIGSYNYTFRMECGDPTEKWEHFKLVMACFTYYEEVWPDLSRVVPEKIPDYKEAFLTHAEALQDPDFGQYMIREIPNGYEVDYYDYDSDGEQESVYRLKNQQNDFLQGRWFRAYLAYSIEWSAETTPTAGALEGIPVEELTLEMVQQAAKKKVNSANHSAWHVKLSVRYGGVLVRVSTVGPEPEWVYEQLLALQTK